MEDNNMLNELQIKLVWMLEMFHNFCLENDLRYYILGGTALGAARHQGFIPWDDDIDIGMPRSDYNKLYLLTKGKRYSKYIFEFPGENEDYAYEFAKLYDTSTTLIENTRYRTKRGIYIDIFPLDGAGQTMTEAKKNFKKIDMIYKVYSTRICSLRKERAFSKNFAIIISRLIPDKILSYTSLINILEKKSSKLNFDSCDCVANYYGAWREKEIADRKWFGNPKLYKFDNIEVFGPEQIDLYLNSLYGNWQELPPIESRKTHHDYIKLDINNSYL